ncbi:MAG TPA: hypothetical protein VMM38_08885 [Aridibacter sp.]|nr:hypothetical protein [Aridibacter sp.]
MIFRRTTVFLAAALCGLIAASAFPHDYVRNASAIRVMILPPPRPIILDWEIDRNRNCGTLWLRLDKDGIVTLNNEIWGSMSNLEDLRQRIGQIVREREENVVFITLDPDKAGFLGAETVKAEFVISAPDSARYSDVIKLVDLAASFEPSSVVLEIDRLVLR